MPLINNFLIGGTTPNMFMYNIYLSNYHYFIYRIVFQETFTLEEVKLVGNLLLNFQCYP